MALFGKKTKKASAPAKKAVVSSSKNKNSASVLIDPRITEKASYGTAETVYVFNVLKTADKKSISREISELYNVVPVKVNIASVPSKVVSNRKGKPGKTSTGKKAYVYVKKGDSIDLF